MRKLMRYFTLLNSLLILVLFLILFFGQRKIFAENLIINNENKELLESFKKEYSSEEEIKSLREKTLKYGGEAVPILTQVMKEDSFPDKNRWIATFLLVTIMGEKASPFISKFLDHNHWVMRMAALKGLLILKEKKYSEKYGELLRDKSLLVRLQAIENIKELDLKEHAQEIWKMIFREQNYQKDKEGKNKRMTIVNEVVRAIGDFKYQKAKIPLLTMIQKKDYDDLFNDLDYALVKITGKNSPAGKSTEKRIFWSKVFLQEKNI